MHLVKSFYCYIFSPVVKTTACEKVLYLSKLVEIYYVNQNACTHISMQHRPPVENSVDSVENLGISPVFFPFFAFVPFCNYWIKICINGVSMQKKRCYGNIAWKGIPVSFLRKSFVFREASHFFSLTSKVWKSKFVKNIQNTFGYLSHRNGNTAPKPIPKDNTGGTHAGKS